MREIGRCEEEAQGPQGQQGLLMGIRLKGQKIGSGSSFVIKKRPVATPPAEEPQPVKRKPGRPRKTPCE